MDERSLERWMRLEIGNLHESIVRNPRPLPDLLDENAPTAPTRDGHHAYDKTALRALHETLPPHVRARLRLPILLYHDTDAIGNVYATDPVAQRALQHLGATNDIRDGRLWISEPLARDLARRYPTCVQFITM